jgi:CRISPR-associated protein Cas1
MGILYLNTEGSKVRKSGGTIVVEKGGETVTTIPLEQISGVVVFTGVHLTEAVVVEFLKMGTSVTYLSTRGQYYGRLESVHSVDVVRQMKQANLTKDSSFCIELSKEFISVKIHNQITILRWFMKNKPETNEGELEQLKIIKNRVKEAVTVEQIMGYEGNAAKIYFSCLSKLCKPEFKFYGRTRQPPKDAFNSMLSYGYTLLMYEIYTILGSHGLYPYFGFMHKPKRGHPALVSDLMEEWRPVLIDAFVLHLVNKGSFKSIDFEVDNSSGGVFLKRHQSKDFLNRYEKRVLTQIKNTDNESSEIFNYRIQLEHQVKMMAKAIENSNSTLYKGYKIR